MTCQIIHYKEDGDNSLDKSSGQIIMSLCDEMGITRSELARRLEVSPSQISRIINEETKTISSEILIALVKEFHVSADYILGLTNEKYSDKKKYDNSYNGVCKISTIRVPMLLMISSFPLGGCLEFVESIEDIPQREVAYAEYYYFCGQYEKSVEYAKKYINHEDIMLKLTANLLCTFANLALDRINSARLSLDQLQVCLKKAMTEDIDNKTKACCVFVASTAKTLLHLNIGNDMPQLSEYVAEFPRGMQLWSAYVLAHRAYLDNEYERSLGIIQASLMTCERVYPIAMIYLNLIAAVDSMNLKQTDKGKEYFMKAWELARPDGLIEGIGEHHGLLQGLIETCLKKEYPNYYEKIIDITYRFSAGWRQIHNTDTNEDVADNLTTTEFTIAMLASRGWTNNEIADYMEITPRTVKQHLSCIFTKLNITNRKQLISFMLK